MTFLSTGHNSHLFSQSGQVSFSVSPKIRFIIKADAPRPPICICQRGPGGTREERDSRSGSTKPLITKQPKEVKQHGRFRTKQYGKVSGSRTRGPDPGRGDFQLIEFRKKLDWRRTKFFDSSSSRSSPATRSGEP